MTNLIINSQPISQHNGLFSLNDLHKVSGNDEKHRPTWFLRNDETQALIHEIESENQIAYDTVIGKGKKQGTYACRELVYRYAMWISPKFSLMVIRAFDALNTGAIPCLPKLSSDDTLPLRNAINMATGVLKLDYATIYKMVHQRFGVDEIKELSKEQVEQAVEYVHRLMIQAEPLADQYKNLDFITQLFNTKEKELKQAYQRVNRLSELVEQLPMECNRTKIDMGISLNDVRYRLNNLVKSTSLLQKTTLPA